MTLTLGTGPLSPDRAGRFDDGTRLSGHPLYLEVLEKRVRGYAGGELVVDARAPRLLHELGALPVWWFARDDLCGALSPTDRSADDDHLGRLRAWDLRVGDRVVRDAGSEVVEAAPGAPELAGLVRVEFDALDRWLEEEDEVVGHPRDPYHRVDVRRSGDHVAVRVGDTVVAESDRPLKVFETGLPVRVYVPVEDVRQEFLSPSLTRTICPYKGIAEYWALTVRDAFLPDAAWAYQQPLGEVLPVRDHVSFLADGVDVALG